MSYRCRLDDQPFGPCAAPHGFAGVAPGTHTFQVRAIDAVGNVGPVATRSFRVDDGAAPPVDPAGTPAQPASRAAGGSAHEVSPSGAAAPDRPQRRAPPRRRTCGPRWPGSLAAWPASTPEPSRVAGRSRTCSASEAPGRMTITWRVSGKAAVVAPRLADPALRPDRRAHRAPDRGRQAAPASRAAHSDHRDRALSARFRRAGGDGPEHVHAQAALTSRRATGERPFDTKRRAEGPGARGASPLHAAAPMAAVRSHAVRRRRSRQVGALPLVAQIVDGVPHAAGVRREHAGLRCRHCSFPLIRATDSARLT